MSKELIITNGDSAADLLRTTLDNCDVLPWRDVLHEGSVPFTKDLPALSLIRAEYLSNKYSLELPQTVRNFKDRDDALQETCKFDRVVLWFEHELYDQLQLIQILDFFASYPLMGTRVYLVQADDFLSEQSSKTIVRLRA